jgi:hypothetical protein
MGLGSFVLGQSLRVYDLRGRMLTRT